MPSQAPSTNPVHRALSQRGILLHILGFHLETTITLPLSANDPHLLLPHVSLDWRTVALERRSFWRNFLFLPLPFNDPNHQLTAFQSLIERSGRSELSFRFLTNLDQHTGNLGSIRVDDLLYGAGTISILDEIIFPNTSDLKYLDCLLSHADNSKLLDRMAEAAFQALEDVDMSFVNIPGLPHRTFAVHGRYTFRSSESGRGSREAKCKISNCIHPLPLNLPWLGMTLVDLGTTIIPPNTLIRILRLTSATLIEGFFYVLFNIDSSKLQHQLIHPVDMISLTKLRVRLVDTSYYPTFLSRFRLPLLCHLWIEWFDERYPFEWDMALYASWLSSASKSLVRLLLTDLPFHPSREILLHRKPYRILTDLEALLKVVSNLKALCLGISIRVPFPVLADIANGTLLPHLKLLEMATDGDPNPVVSSVRFRNKDHSSSGLSKITALRLALPSTLSAPKRWDLEKKVEDLHLARGYGLQFLPSCPTCFTHCYFGN